jgi:hypothetical protein
MRYRVPYRLLSKVTEIFINFEKESERILLYSNPDFLVNLNLDLDSVLMIKIYYIKV